MTFMNLEEINVYEKSPKRVKMDVREDLEDEIYKLENTLIRIEEEIEKIKRSILNLHPRNF